MKKYLILFLTIIICYGIINIKETNGQEKNQINLVNLNSNKFVSFAKEQKIANKISKICSYDFCDYLRGNNITNSFEIYKKKYQDYIASQSSEELSYTTILKGFPITSIYLMD